MKSQTPLLRFFIASLLLCGLFYSPAKAQPLGTDVKGSWYAFWGWNRGFYTNSDIHFVGDKYDFVLNDVQAKDRPTPFSIESYFFPLQVSVPQTNWRLGYFYNDEWEVSIGQDHMKYVMVQDQTVKIDGEIDFGNRYDGSYDQDDLKLVEQFLVYEHTDGLNYFNAELTHRSDILRFPLWTQRCHLEHLHGVGIGAMIPRTATYLMEQQRYDRFHLSGIGVSAKAGLNLHLGKYFFIQTELKAGYINMWDIRITHNANEKAKQSFFFLQPDFVMGTRFLLGKENQ